jgi:hypothetical protein
MNRITGQVNRTFGARIRVFIRRQASDAQQLPSGPTTTTAGAVKPSETAVSTKVVKEAPQPPPQRPVNNDKSSLSGAVTCYCMCITSAQNSLC